MCVCVGGATLRCQIQTLGLLWWPDSAAAAYLLIPGSLLTSRPTTPAVAPQGLWPQSIDLGSGLCLSPVDTAVRLRVAFSADVIRGTAPAGEQIACSAWWEDPIFTLERTAWRDILSLTCQVPLLAELHPCQSEQHCQGLWA